MWGLGIPELDPFVLLIIFAVWGALYWHELRHNRVSWRAAVVLLLLVILWVIVVARSPAFF